MSSSSATYNGALIFGQSVAIQAVSNPSAQQINAFFGVTGTQLIFGGGRGRMFFVKGVLVGGDIGELNAAEATIDSYDDGIARTLVDTRGRTWPYVVFTGQLQPDPMGPRPFDGGWALPYRATFRGLL